MSLLTCPLIALLGVSSIFVVRGYYYEPCLGLSNSTSGITPPIYVHVFIQNMQNGTKGTKVVEKHFHC
jgi:hypothetical protein